MTSTVAWLAAWIPALRRWCERPSRAIWPALSVRPAWGRNQPQRRISLLSSSHHSVILLWPHGGAVALIYITFLFLLISYCMCVSDRAQLRWYMYPSYQYAENVQRLVRSTDLIRRETFWVCYISSSEFVTHKRWLRLLQALPWQHVTLYPAEVSLMKKNRIFGRIVPDVAATRSPTRCPAAVLKISTGEVTWDYLRASSWLLMSWFSLHHSHLCNTAQVLRESKQTTWNQPRL